MNKGEMKENELGEPTLLTKLIMVVRIIMIVVWETMKAVGMSAMKALGMSNEVTDEAMTREVVAEIKEMKIEKEKKKKERKKPVASDGKPYANAETINDDSIRPYVIDADGDSPILIIRPNDMDTIAEQKMEGDGQARNLLVQVKEGKYCVQVLTVKLKIMGKVTAAATTHQARAAVSIDYNNMVLMSNAGVEKWIRVNCFITANNKVLHRPFRTNDKSTAIYVSTSAEDDTKEVVIAFGKLVPILVPFRRRMSQIGVMFKILVPDGYALPVGVMMVVDMALVVVTHVWSDNTTMIVVCIKVDPLVPVVEFRTDGNTNHKH